MNVAVTRWAWVLLLASGAAAGQAKITDERVLAESASGENWFLKGGNFRGEHFSPLAQVNAGNVDSLGLAWVTTIPIPDGIATTPIVVDGVAYISGAYSVVYAVDAESGAVLWSYDPGVLASLDDASLAWRGRASRGIAVWDGRVYVATADCKLIALDAADGKPVWSKVTCDIDLNFSISDSPYVGGGKVFLGNSGSETELKNRGYVSAYDAATGEMLWRFFIVPSDEPAENDTPALKMAAKTWSQDQLEKYGGGGHSWNEMTYDPESNQLFFGTSGALPYAYELRSPEGGDNLFLSSIVAVDADTGEYQWHYQTVDKDSWDYNATMNIILADLDIGDEERETVLIAPKNGFHYALDRHTGELLTAGKFAKVNWATHINMETGRPVYDPAAAYWELGKDEMTLVWPNMWGAHSWNPMAFHPGLGLSYIPVVDVPGYVNNQGTGEDIVMLTEIDDRPHAPGKLVAFDPVSQGIRWSIDHALPFNGGVMATAGNLVFQGTAGGRFEAYAADTGRKLWSVQTGSPINAAPASYAIDGTQYVLIPVGAGGGVQFLYPEMHADADTKGPTRLMAFTLEGRAAMPPPAGGYPPLPEQPPLEASAEEIETGKRLYAANCMFCHGSGGVARFGGSVPDLRWADADTHAAWHGIVIGGARAASGMPAVEISAQESEAIRHYLLSLSAELRERR